MGHGEWGTQSPFIRHSEIRHFRIAATDPRLFATALLKSLPCSYLHASKFNAKTDLQRLGRRSGHLRGVDVAAPQADAADALSPPVAVGQWLCGTLQARFRR